MEKRKLCKHLLSELIICTIIIFCFFLIVGCDGKKLCQNEKVEILELMNIHLEEVDSMSLVYHGYEVRVSDSVKDSFFRDILCSEQIFPDDRHEYLSSDYIIRLRLSDNSYRDFSFYWFNGLKPSTEYYVYNMEEEKVPIPEYSDTRFDVEIDGIIYHYEFTSEHIWNEYTNETVYESAAQRLHYPRVNKINGIDYLPNIVYDSYSLFVQEDITWQQVVDNSEIVLIAEYEGVVFSSEEGTFGLPFAYDFFYVSETLKGQRESWILIPRFVNILSEQGVCGLEQKDILNPNFIEDSRYLLCLNGSEGCIMKYSDHISLSAIQIDEDICYARYNTEKHPFHRISLKTVKDYLFKDNVEICETANDEGVDKNSNIVEYLLKTEDILKLTDESTDIKELSKSAEVIIICQYMGKVINQNYKGDYSEVAQGEIPLDLVYDLFSVRECIRGDYVDLDTILISSSFVKIYYNNVIYDFTDENDAEFQVESKYYLFGYLLNDKIVWKGLPYKSGSVL